MWQKIELYIISLAFLFALIGANQVPICFGEGCEFMGFSKLFLSNPPIILFCTIGIICSVVFFFNFKYRIVKGSNLPAETISEIESVNYENLTFLATYIIPLVCFDLDFHLGTGRNFFMLILVLILIGWIYVKTNIFYTNPTLAVLNFKIYKITTEQRQNVIVISKNALEKNDMILPNKMDDKIFFASKYIIKK
jgi:hypothetical protein